MSNQQIINECKEALLEELKKANGDILKSDLYDLIDAGEITDIAMAIKSLRDEGKIVVFGDGKSARIMSGGIPEPKVVNTIVSEIASVQPIDENAFKDLYNANPTAVEQITQDIIKVIEDTRNDTPVKPDPILPKLYPGKLVPQGKTAEVAQCLFTAKTGNKWDSLTLDVISTRSKFKGTRASLNGAVDYLVNLGYIAKERTGSKPLYTWSNKLFYCPFPYPDVVPMADLNSPVITIKHNRESSEVLKGTISNGVHLTKEQVHFHNKATEILDKEIVVELKSTMNDLADELKIDKPFEDYSSPDIQRVPSEWERNRIADIDSLIGESVRSIGSLTRFIETLSKERQQILA